jgi:hypothetical protein
MHVEECQELSNLHFYDVSLSHSSLLPINHQTTGSPLHKFSNKLISTQFMITITMSKHFLSLLSFSLLLFTSFAIRTDRSEFDRFNQCQLDNINALEPDHRVESEAGLTETWNPNHPELQCAGVSLIKRTIDPNGLHLPSYSPSPQLIFIIQGKEDSVKIFYAFIEFVICN